MYSVFKIYMYWYNTIFIQYVKNSWHTKAKYFVANFDLVSTHRHNARNILHYLHRKDDLFKRDRCEKMVDANDERVRCFSERKPHRGRSPWNRYYVIMILQEYSRLTHIFLPVSARLFHLLLWDSGNCEMISFGKVRNIY